MVEGHQMEQEFAYNAADDKFYGVIDKSNIIEGENPTKHFVNYMQKAHKWQFASVEDVTGILAENFQKISDDFKDHKYTVKAVNFSISGDDGRISIALQSGKTNVEIYYLYDMTIADDGSYTINYREPYVTSNNKRASQILTTIAPLSDFLTCVNGTYTAEQATGTCFDLHILKITCSNGSTATVQAVK